VGEKEKKTEERTEGGKERKKKDRVT